ncbi:hypothetical protein PAHA111176_08115 [Parendozoicomonas haliclonae]|uniref:Uncharacterized protein n=1 Tax=Parendozoicomonas haliclonae TaxID=1960125 RepID=A0A1X7AE90_9GAMM|nr:hypothetical protein EHSB41UT_00308 [Parendozoicomonas haliclonae]
MRVSDADLSIYAQWILDHLTKKDRDFLSDIKSRVKPNTCGKEFWVSMYATVVDRRKAHLTKAVASDKCKAEQIPVIDNKRLREAIAERMLRIDMPEVT